MKVILTQDVRGQGKKGQLIDAAEGYARNFLLPRKLAVLATADAINTMNLKEKARRAEEAANRQAAVEMGGKLKNVTVKLTAKGGKEGKLGVEGMKPEILLDALRRAGATIDEKSTVKGKSITKADLYDLGLIGPDSVEKRKALCKGLELPEHLSANALVEVLNLLMSREELEKLFQ